MKIVALDFMVVTLPFRFAFSHSLAARNSSTNVVGRAVLEKEDGSRYAGWGEGVPRHYVTGETTESALAALRSTYAPAFLGREFASSTELILALNTAFRNFGLESTASGSAWCALELALLDSLAKLEETQLTELLGGAKRYFVENGITYGGVIPFGGERAYAALLLAYRLAGFQTVKVKVGRDFDLEIAKMARARQILGSEAKLRVDANCAWTAEETVQFAERARPYGVASIEQPVPADDWKGLRFITERIPEAVVADESLCTIDQAQQLATQRICSDFNIRISKVGGMLPALKIAAIARQNDIACHLGAQVGESGILSAAGRTFAAVNERFENYEGAANKFLLKVDLTRENLTFGRGGKGRLLKAPGLGITVMSGPLRRQAQSGSRDVKKQPAETQSVT